MHDIDICRPTAGCILQNHVHCMGILVETVSPEYDLKFTSSNIRQIIQKPAQS